MGSYDDRVLSKVFIGGREFDLFNELQLKPWDQIDEWDRSQDWFDRFRAYLELGRRRTMVLAYETYKKELLETTGKDLHSPKAPANWFHQKNSAFWDLRCKAWDDLADKIAQRDLADQIVERRKQVMLDDYEAGDDLRQRAKDYLVQLKIFDKAGTKEIVDPVTGKKRIIEIVKPAVSLAQITGALDVASKLQRRALGLRDDVVLLLEDQKRLLTGQTEAEETLSWESVVEMAESSRLAEELKTARGRVQLLEGILSRHGIAYPREEVLELPSFIDGGEMVVDVEP